MINALSARDHPVQREEPDDDGRAARAEGRDRKRRAHRRRRKSASGSTSWCSRARTSTTAGSRRTCTRRCSSRSSRRRRSCSTSTWTRSRRSLDNRKIKDPITNEERDPDERFLRAVEEKIHISDSGKQSFRQEVVRKAMGAYKRGDKFTLDSHAPLHDAIEQYLFEQRRDVLRLVSSTTPPGRGDAAEDLGRREAPGGRVRLRQPQRARGAELRDHAAGAGMRHGSDRAPSWTRSA